MTGRIVHNHKQKNINKINYINNYYKLIDIIIFSMFKPKCNMKFCGYAKISRVTQSILVNIDSRL